MIWFTSDTHFDHSRIIELSYRPFNTSEEMNETIINNWNSKVTKGDTVYFLGDFAWKKPEPYLWRLNGNIEFIKGNHDSKKIKAPCMMTIKPEGLLDEYGNKRLIVLCHYPMRSWKNSHFASWHLFGHHHGQLEPYGLSFDIGVDTNKFYPYSLDDIKEKMETIKPIVDFRK